MPDKPPKIENPIFTGEDFETGYRMVKNPMAGQVRRTLSGDYTEPDHIVIDIMQWLNANGVLKPKNQYLAYQNKQDRKAHFQKHLDDVKAKVAATPDKDDDNWLSKVWKFLNKPIW